jgi:hypothetical protein
MRIHEGYKATWDGHMSTTKEITRNPTLREYYAGLAMQGLLTADTEFERTEEDIAMLAVKQADTLIAELNKEAEDAE